MLSGGKRITILTAGNLNTRRLTSRVLSRDLKIILVGGVGLQSADWIKCIGESQGPCLAISERNVSAPHQRQNLGGFDRKDGKEVAVT